MGWLRLWWKLLGSLREQRLSQLDMLYLYPLSYYWRVETPFGRTILVHCNLGACKIHCFVLINLLMGLSLLKKILSFILPFFLFIFYRWFFWGYIWVFLARKLLSSFRSAVRFCGRLRARRLHTLLFLYLDYHLGRLISCVFFDFLIPIFMFFDVFRKLCAIWYLLFAVGKINHIGLDFVLIFVRMGYLDMLF